MRGAAGVRANVDGCGLPDYEARSFEAGIRPAPFEPDPSERKSLASRRFLRSAGGFEIR
jgi:hypothetical protein